MSNIVKKNSTVIAINMQKVEDKIAVIRNMKVIADADVAALYGVQTREVNQAVRNNPDKFPPSYMFELNTNELHELRSKILTTTDAKPNAIKLACMAEVRRRKSLLKRFCNEPQFYQSVHGTRSLHAGHNTERRCGT